MGKAVEFLDPGQRAAVAEKCFKVDDKSSTKDELRGNCPFHDDKNPSFSYNPQKDAFYCLGCGVKGDLIGLWSHSKNFTDAEGFAAFCKEFDSSSKEYQAKKKITCAFLEDVWNRFPPLPEPFVQRMIKERSWTKEGIEKLDLRLQTLRFDKKIGDVVPIFPKYQNKIAIAIRDAKGKIQNIRFYQPGAKEFKLTSFAPGLGKARLWPEPEKWKDGSVWIVEGEPDAICAISHGLNATTQTAGAGSWKKTFSKFLRDKNVIIAYDADGKGIRGGEKLGLDLSSVANSIKVVRWPDFMGKKNGQWPEDKGQDLTDWFSRHRKSLKDLYEILPEAKIIESTKDRFESVQMFFDGSSFKPALLAQELLTLQDLITDPLSKRTYRWNERYWEEIDIDYLAKQALELLRDEASTSRASDAVNQAKVMSLPSPDIELNHYKNILCLRNGMLNLDDYSFKPHKKEYYSTCMLDVEYNKKAKCDRWEDFLDQTIQDYDTIGVMQEYTGYILTPDISYEKALLLYGPGGDGKSTFFHILQALIGETACSAVSLPGLEDQFYRATLHNKLLNVSSETEGFAFASNWFKAIVSGDLISAAFKNKDPFEFKPHLKMVFAFNRWPRVLDNTDGFFRRIIPITFKKQFKGKERDLRLKEKLLKELPGILNWALEGLQRLREQGDFLHSADINRTMIKYKYENNPVLGFVEDCCTTQRKFEDEFMETKQQDLYGYYRKFCSRCGFAPLNLNHFTRELRIIQPGINVIRRASGKAYTGIRYLLEE